jgi:predicted nucleic acid-binding protein
VLAVALKMRTEGLDVAIWSQDKDFDDAGISVWTTGQILDQLRELDERQ